MWNCPPTTDSRPQVRKSQMTFGKNVYRAEADADGKAEIPEVAKVLAYDVNVSLPAYEEIDTKAKLTGDIVSLGYKLSEIRENPVYLEAVPASDNSRVNPDMARAGSIRTLRKAGYTGTTANLMAAIRNLHWILRGSTCLHPEDILEKG